MNPIERRRAFMARCTAKVNEAMAAGIAATDLKLAMDKGMLAANEAAALLKKEPRLQKSFADKALAGMKAEKRRKAVLAEERLRRAELGREYMSILDALYCTTGKTGQELWTWVDRATGERPLLEQKLDRAHGLLDAVPHEVRERNVKDSGRRGHDHLPARCVLFLVGTTQALEQRHALWDGQPPEIWKPPYLDECCSCGHLRAKHDDRLFVSPTAVAALTLNRRFIGLAQRREPCAACENCPQFSWTEFVS
jgi:hypothetical protein